MTKLIICSSAFQHIGAISTGDGIDKLVMTYRKHKKITVIGNSVALRIRPVPSSDKKLTGVYSRLLETELNNSPNQDLDWHIKNMGLSRLMVREVYDSIDTYIRTFPDIFILNLGCVEAPSREIPLWFSDIIFKRRFRPLYNVSIKLYESLIKPYLRPFFLYLRRRKSWAPISEFEHYFELVLKTLKKETYSQIVVIGINPGSSRIENKLPGTTEKYKLYSDVMERLCLEHDLDYIDVSDMGSDSYFPDGVHYNSHGHQEISRRILKKIRKENDL